jgi:hypothetical protein
MTGLGLVCGPCGTELPPNAKFYNESAVPSYRVPWTGLSPHLAAALPEFLLPVRQPPSQNVGAARPEIWQTLCGKRAAV